MKKPWNQSATRRSMLKALGSVGTLMLVDCNSSGGLSGSGSDGGSSGGAGGGGGAAGSGGSGGATDMGTATSSGDGGICVLDPNLTKGPYWIDEKLNRSDITTDSNGVANPNPRPGLPLQLQIQVYAYASSGCTALPSAQVDIWHCDGSGTYSDVANMGGSNAVGQNFLRGYQVTDSSGIARFTTIYPGWYSGRTVHIHVKVRLFDANSNTTTEATTQLFFDDSITDQVYAANAPYSARPNRDTRNAGDNIYGGRTELLVNLSGDPSSGLTAAIALGVDVGSVFAG
jgi:protocatechuate 3,4-dioxygenase beta subunit